MTAQELTSHDRLLTAAKRLFAERGYDETTSAAIARAARTSQSQFIKHFKDKTGVLAAIYDQSWSQLTSAIRLAITRIADPTDRLKLLVDMTLSYLARDAEFRTIFALRGPAIRTRGTVVSIGTEYDNFVAVFDEIFDQMRVAGQLLGDVDTPALRSALLGAVHALLRWAELQSNTAMPMTYFESAIQTLFFRFLGSCTTNTEHPREIVETLVAQEPVEQPWVSNYLELASKVLGPSGNA